MFTFMNRLFSYEGQLKRLILFNYLHDDFEENKNSYIDNLINQKTVVIGLCALALFMPLLLIFTSVFLALLCTPDIQHISIFAAMIAYYLFLFVYFRLDYPIVLPAINISTKSVKENRRMNIVLKGMYYNFPVFMCAFAYAMNFEYIGAVAIFMSGILFLAGSLGFIFVETLYKELDDSETHIGLYQKKLRTRFKSRYSILSEEDILGILPKSTRELLLKIKFSLVDSMQKQSFFLTDTLRKEILEEINDLVIGLLCIKYQYTEDSIELNNAYIECEAALSDIYTFIRRREDKQHLEMNPDDYVEYTKEVSNIYRILTRK